MCHASAYGMTQSMVRVDKHINIIRQADNGYLIQYTNGKYINVSPVQVKAMLSSLTLDQRALFVAGDMSFLMDYVKNNPKSFQKLKPTSVQEIVSASSDGFGAVVDAAKSGTQQLSTVLAYQNKDMKLGELPQDQLGQNFSYIAHSGERGGASVQPNYGVNHSFGAVPNITPNVGSTTSAHYSAGSSRSKVSRSSATDVAKLLEKVKTGSLADAKIAIQKLYAEYKESLANPTSEPNRFAQEHYQASLQFLVTRGDFKGCISDLIPTGDHRLTGELVVANATSSNVASTADLVSTPLGNVINKEVDACLEIAINKLNTIDPTNNMDDFINASMGILADFKAQGLLEPTDDRKEEVLGIFAKAVLRRLNPITQFKDLAKLAYHIAKWTLLESSSSAYVTAESLQNAQKNLDGFFETIKAMDPRSLTADQWAEFLGTVVGDFAFFGGIAKVVHYFANVPVTLEAIQARPLDYAHSVIQYEQLKTALQIEEFTSIVDVTKHGLQRLLERGFQANEISDLIKIPDKIVTQSNGLKGFIKKTGEKFNFMVINSEDKKVVTAIRNIDFKRLQSLGRNYGWNL